MTYELMPLLLAGLSGWLLGMFFYGVLWWTVKRGLASPKAAQWFLASLLLRMGITLAGFYWLGAGQWQRLVACLSGFLIARLCVAWLTRPIGNTPQQALSGKGKHHAP